VYAFCNCGLLCSEHWEGLSTRTASTSRQSNGRDESFGATASTESGTGGLGARAHLAMDDFGLQSSGGSSSLLGGDMHVPLDFAEAETQRAPSISAESPMSMVRSNTISMRYDAR
jgi:hypothetical protein